MSAFNDNIKLIRGLTGLSQKLFAKLIKSNESNIKTYETTGVQCKDFIVLRELTDVASISLEDLKSKQLKATDISINVEKVDIIKKGLDTISMVSEPHIEYKTEARNTADFLAGRLAEKDATIVQIEKRITDAFAFAQKMEDHYLDSKHEKDRMLKIIEDYIKDIHANSKKTVERVHSLKTEIAAENREIMETLDQIAGNNPGTTAAKAGSIELAHQVHKSKTGKKVGVRKTNK